jgi:diguanylate cyclase (GGDEF)-like protein/putative nucleotidyltransferase with HDIG domain
VGAVLLALGPLFWGYAALYERAAGGLTLLAALRFALALLPLVMFGLSFALRSVLPKEVGFALRVTTLGLTLWGTFEALFDVLEPPETGDWLELLFTSLVIFGVLAHLATSVGSAQRAQQQAREAAERDPLTGLLNRRGIERHYAALPPTTPLTVMMLDLNGLKRLNDLGGHSEGDAHLCLVAQTLQAHLPQALLGRWGGDEFVALLPRCTALETRERLLKVEGALQHHTGPLPFAAGWVETHSGQPLGRAVALADARMYEQKEAQRHEQLRLTGEPVAFGAEAFAARILHLERPEEVIRVGLATARTLLDFDTALYFERCGETFQLRAADGHRAEELPRSGGLHTLHKGRGVSGQVLQRGVAVWESDYPSSPLALPEYVAAGVKSLISVPVRDRGVIVGVFSLVMLSTWKAITPAARSVLEGVALRLGHALEHRRVLGEVRATLEGGLLALGVALEARDLETAGHTQRVVAQAERLAKALALPAELTEALRFGAYLHDIGKLAVPDAVLLKPGKLTPEEWEVMKLHSSRGFDIASKLPTLHPEVLNVIRHHHERWDGGGYPDGLAGHAIPLVARIFAVCDVYDALTSERPYKPAWSPEAARRELCAQAGRQFDAAIVRAFLSLLDASPRADGAPFAEVAVSRVAPLGTAEAASP